MDRWLAKAGTARSVAEVLEPEKKTQAKRSRATTAKRPARTAKKTGHEGVDEDEPDQDPDVGGRAEVQGGDAGRWPRRGEAAGARPVPAWARASGDGEGAGDNRGLGGSGNARTLAQRRQRAGRPPRCSSPRRRRERSAPLQRTRRPRSASPREPGAPLPSPRRPRPRRAGRSLHLRQPHPLRRRRHLRRRRPPHLAAPRHRPPQPPPHRTPPPPPSPRSTTSSRRASSSTPSPPSSSPSAPPSSPSPSRGPATTAAAPSPKSPRPSPPSSPGSAPCSPPTSTASWSAPSRARGRR